MRSEFLTKTCRYTV